MIEVHVRTIGARHKASVFLAGRDLTSVERVAADIQRAGGNARAAALDALNQQQVTAYLERVMCEAGKIDAIANLVGPRPQDFGNGSNTLNLLRVREHVHVEYLVAAVPWQAVGGRGVDPFVVPVAGSERRAKVQRIVVLGVNSRRLELELERADFARVDRPVTDPGRNRAGVA